MELHIETSTSKEASDYDYATFSGARTLTLVAGTKSLVIKPGTIIGYRDGRNVVYVVTPDKGLDSEYKISEDDFDRKVAPKCDSATKAQARKAFSGKVEKPASKVAPKPVKISEISERPGRVTKSPKLDKTNTVTPSKKISTKVAPITEKDIKAMAKKLKLPGGAGVVVTDTSYTWNKKGGQADSIMMPVRGNLTANGFKSTDAKSLGLTASGIGSYFTDGKYVVYVAAHMGARKEDNWYLITLSVVGAKFDGMVENVPDKKSVAPSEFALRKSAAENAVLQDLYSDPVMKPVASLFEKSKIEINADKSEYRLSTGALTDAQNKQFVAWVTKNKIVKHKSGGIVTPNGGSIAVAGIGGKYKLIYVSPALNQKINANFEAEDAKG